MRAAWAAAALVLLLLPGAAQAPVDPGLAPIWDEALAAPLRALPREQPEAFLAGLARLDAIASSFDESARRLGAEGSGPLLQELAPGAGGLRGVALGGPAMAEVLQRASDIRAGTTGDDTQRLAGALQQVGELLRRLEGPVQGRSAQRPWQEAWDWYLRLQERMPAYEPTAEGPLPPGILLEGDLWPGGRLVAQVRNAPPGAVLATPWGDFAVGGGSRRTDAEIPQDAQVGPFEVRLTADGATVARAEGTLGPVPTRLEIVGPSSLRPNEAAVYRLRLASPLPVPGGITYSVNADGGSVPVSGATFAVRPQAEGTLALRASADAPHPWSDASAALDVRVATLTVPKPEPERGTPWWLVALAAGGVALALLAALRRRGPSPAVPDAPKAPARLPLLASLWRWWREPVPAVEADFRRAARLLRDDGRLGPSATHDQVAERLRQLGMSPSVAQRLADAYERHTYGGSASAVDDYWNARRRM